MWLPDREKDDPNIILPDEGKERKRRAEMTVQQV
jgi:hypothetical protein